MEKLKMHTPDIAEENFRKLAQMFPNAITETVNENGEVVRAIDADILRQEISCEVVEGRQERYQFTWPDKRKSVVLANRPIAKTLRLVREKSVGRDGTQGSIDTENIYIEGDNLDALKLLRETYLGKVKMIYIDPPYNTGNDFVYEDDFTQSTDEYITDSGQLDEQGNRLVQNLESNGRFHTDWLNMLYPRLKIARDFLTEDGVIFISIDDNEQYNLKKICDEVFGSQNFITNIVWQSTAGSNTGTNVITVTENILLYSKNYVFCKFNTMPIEDDYKYINRDEYYEKRGGYILNKLDRRMTGGHYSEALNYPIEMPDGTMVYPGSTLEKNNENWNYRWSKTKVQWGIENGFLVFKNINGKWNAYFKQYLKVDNNDNPINRSVPYQNIIYSEQFNTSQGTKEIMTMFGNKFFDYAKPSGLIKYLIEFISNRNDIIMDFFSGSATTAHAVMQLNAEDGGKRKFIMVQLPEITPEKSEARKAGYKTICDIGEDRIKKAGQKIRNISQNSVLSEVALDLFQQQINQKIVSTDVEEEYNKFQNLDIGFRVFCVDSSNMENVYYTPDEWQQSQIDLFADNIKSDRTPEDLLFQVMLDLGIVLSEKIEETEIDGKKVFSVAGGYLIACFDSDVTENTVKAIAQQKPFYAVFRDSGMANDSVATNFEQIFETYSPETVRRVL